MSGTTNNKWKDISKEDFFNLLESDMKTHDGMKAVIKETVWGVIENTRSIQMTLDLLIKHLKEHYDLWRD